jgi:hypothetical protein
LRGEAEAIQRATAGVAGARSRLRRRSGNRGSAADFFSNGALWIASAPPRNDGFLLLRIAQKSTI